MSNPLILAGWPKPTATGSSVCWVITASHGVNMTINEDAETPREAETSPMIKIETQGFNEVEVMGRKFNLSDGNVGLLGSEDARTRCRRDGKRIGEDWSDWSVHTEPDGLSSAELTLQHGLKCEYSYYLAKNGGWKNITICKPNRRQSEATVLASDFSLTHNNSNEKLWQLAEPFRDLGEDVQAYIFAFMIADFWVNVQNGRDQKVESQSDEVDGSLRPGHAHSITLALSVAEPALF
ncbi:hypothetical protein C8R46DRAFT_1217053 [Mycena filopes]|nr:hypothetical protein C8R46DRAFT_1217053 [Mycena filopes]